MAFNCTENIAPDFYCDTIDEAIAESRRRKSSPVTGGMITRIEESPYEGWRVRTVDAELFVDQLAEPILPRIPSGTFGAQR